MVHRQGSSVLIYNIPGKKATGYKGSRREQPHEATASV